LAKNSGLSSVMPSQGSKRITALSPVLVDAAKERLSRHPKTLQRDPREAKAGVSKLLLDALLLLLLGRERGCLGGGSTCASRAGPVSFDGAGTVDTMLEP